MKKKKRYMIMRCIHVQILINHKSDFIDIVKSKFFEIFSELRDIDLSKKRMGVRCCIDLISDMSKI